jgi:hypothetical protein
MNVARMDSHGGWIATPSDLTAFFVHINGFEDTDQLLRDEMTTPTTSSCAKGLFGMNTPATADPSYVKGLFVNSSNNWWHGSSLPGTETISVRTNADFCWSAFTNTQSRFQICFPHLMSWFGIWRFPWLPGTL